MTAWRQDIDLVAGEAKTVRYPVDELDENGQRTGPANLTGAAAVWQTPPAGGLPGIRKTLGAGIRLEGAATLGVLLVDFVAGDTAAAVSPVARDYELRVFDAAGNPSPVTTGTFGVVPTVITAA